MKKNNNDGLKIQYDYRTACFAPYTQKWQTPTYNLYETSQYLIGATRNALYTYYLIELYIDTVTRGDLRHILGFFWNNFV